MNKPPNSPPPFLKPSKADADAHRAALTAAGWCIVKPGDIAELRRTHQYHLFELASFRTKEHRSAHGALIDYYFEIWRRARTQPPLADERAEATRTGGTTL